MKFIIGKKIEMSRVWRDDEAITVTKVSAGPCTVIQIKTKDKDGYDAVQIGYGVRAEKNIAKPQIGHMKGLGNFRFLREFRYDHGHNQGYEKEFDSLKAGVKLTVGIFSAGDKVEVEGVTKGKGFQGTVKRHGFHGHNTTHGTKDQVRMPGSIGAGEPQHVFKGMRMAGRMGDEAITIRNLKIIEVNNEENTLLISGCLPGARNSLVLISGAGELKLAAEPEEKPVVEPTEAAEVKTPEPVKTEEKKEENKPAAEVAKKPEPVLDDSPARNASPARIATQSVAGGHIDAGGEKAEEKKVAPAEVKPAAVNEKPAEIVDEKKAEKKEEKPEAEKKAETVADKKPAEAEKQEPETAKPAEATDKKDAVTPVKTVESFVDGYQKRFNELPKSEKEKYSSPEITKAVSELEEKYKMDLVSVVARLAIKEVTAETLAKFLTDDYKLEAARAEEISTEIKDKVIKLVA
jgi:large subunit ribosomal protein L3